MNPISTRDFEIAEVGPVTLRAVGVDSVSAIEVAMLGGLRQSTRIAILADQMKRKEHTATNADEYTAFRDRTANAREDGFKNARQ